MNTPNQPDPLAAMKAASPGDPIIPVFEHINRTLDASKSHAKSIARDAASLRRTRSIFFLLACLVSAGADRASTWYESRLNPSPDIEILRRAGIEVRITDANEEVKLTLGGRKPNASAIEPTATTKAALILTWRKQ